MNFIYKESKFKKYLFIFFFLGGGGGRDGGDGGEWVLE